jgi:hypothetical protein
VVHVQVVFRLIEHGQMTTLFIAVCGREEVVNLLPLLGEGSGLYQLTEAEGHKDIGMVRVVHRTPKEIVGFRLKVAPRLCSWFFPIVDV